jgi:hypothetical protein
MLHCTPATKQLMFCIHFTQLIELCALLPGSCFDLAWPPLQHICRPHLQTMIIKIRLRYLHSNNSEAWVRERTIPTERPPLVGKLVPTFADRGCHVVSVPDSYCRILGFLDRSRHIFFQVAPQFNSRGWVDPVLRKCGSAGNRTRTSGSVARSSDHRWWWWHGNVET